MQYLLSFLEGIVTFISPCLLPMLPIYVSYFAGGKGEKTTKKTLRNAIGFVIGFTLVFASLGAFAGTLGSVLKEHQTAVNIITGAIVVVFGLYFLGVLNLSFLRGMRASSTKKESEKKELGFFPSLVFGMVFSIGWTPCVGAFLGSALMLASQQGETIKGVLMLLTYSAGLGIPFIVSALLIEKLKGAFDFIKRHYGVINKVCGILLIGLGVLMMTGLFDKILSNLM